MGRAPCCDKANVKRGPWSPEEDATLKNYVQSHGTGGNWIALPLKAGSFNSWFSRLSALRDVARVADYDGLIISDQTSNMEVLPKRKTTLYALFIVKWEAGKWSLIASQLPGRTDNDVKNYWNTKLKKKLLAGKSSFNVDNNGGLLNANNNNIPTQPLPYNLDYSTTSLPILSDVSYGFSVSNSSTSQNMGLDPVMQFSTPDTITNLSQSGPNLDNSHNNIVVVSSSQEGSALSDSTGNGYGEDTGSIILMDDQQFSYEFPYEFVNGVLAGPSFEFSHGDIKTSQGLNQSVATNPY
ncbi:hypothetical protein CXB51_018124 [Gossypium anomalum]|uniref:Uncharacterized protein n=1 Tax=Gossypium anomalum TaxID=47600 RepID=A0A8J5YP97_9ROSI|nr:hypothetical protein CXB51_018124 [Gossypium anomalum]